jgi:hypothetical protein
MEIQGHDLNKLIIPKRFPKIKIFENEPKTPFFIKK